MGCTPAPLSMATDFLSIMPDVPSPLRDADASPPYHAHILRSALPPMRPHAPRPAACARALIRSGFTSVASWQSCVIWWMTYNRPVRRTRDSNTRRRRVSDGEWVSGESGPGDAHPVRFAGAKLPTRSSKRPRLSSTQVAAIASRLPSEGRKQRPSEPAHAMRRRRRSSLRRHRRRE